MMPKWIPEREMQRLREACNLSRENRIATRLDYLRRHVWHDWKGREASGPKEAGDE